MKRFSFLSRLATGVAAVALTVGVASFASSCSEDDTTDEVVITKLAAPADPAAGVAAEDALTFSWKGVDKAAGYTAQIYMDKLGAAIRETVTDLTSVTFTGLQDNQTYYFRVRANDAVNEARNSVWSAWVESRTIEIPMQLMPLDTPKDPICDGAKTTTTSAVFTWEPVEQAASYTYKLVNDGSEADRTAVIEGLTVTISGLTQGASYTFSVKANPAEGSTQYRSSSYSKSVKVTTVSLLATPSKPENTLCMAEALAFSWTEVPNAAGYAYELYEGGGATPIASGVASSRAVVRAFATSGTISAETTNTSASFTGLKKDTYYSFRIKATPASGASFQESAFTDYTIVKTRLTDATPFAAPVGVAAPTESVKPTSVVVKWTAVAGAGSYKYQWGTSQVEAEASEPVVIEPVDGVLAAEFKKSELVPSTTYVVRVMACAAAEDATHSDSDWSAWVSVKSADLLAAITVSTADELMDAFGALKDAGVVTLNAGTYSLAEAVTIDKAVTIKAAASARPVIQVEKTWEIAANATISALAFEGVTLEAATTAPYLFNVGAAIPFTISTLSFTNCQVNGLTRSLFRQQAANDTQKVGAIVVDNCQMTNGVEAGQSYAVFQFSTASTAAIPASVMIKKSTLQVQNILNISKIAAPAGGLICVVTLDQCTLYNLGLSASGKNLFDLGKGGSTLKVTNSILGKSAAAKDVNGSAVTKEISNFYYTSDHGITTPQMASDVTVVGENSVTVFVDPAAGNFMFNSALSASYDMFNGIIGDPRWWK